MTSRAAGHGAGSILQARYDATQLVDCYVAGSSNAVDEVSAGKIRDRCFVRWCEDA